ncbi:MAG TPA: hypothetical protein VF587_14800 [Solirubrobacteraceae bacterium]|jgi:hypothetical protein
MSAALPSRLLLAGGGVALLVSLFLPWFSGGVSGWEHFAWADAVFAVLALVLVATAALRPRAAVRVVVAVLCGAGIAVVLGHGFSPDVPIRDEQDIRSVAAGGHVALGALAAGIVGALAAWPRLLLVAAAAGLLAALPSGWGTDAVYFTFVPHQEVFDSTDYPNGFERWKVLDAALVAVAAALLLVAFAGRVADRLASRPVRLVLAAASLAAAVCIVIGIRDQAWADEGVAIGAAKGPVVALLALAGAVGGLALVRPPAPAARAG